VIAGSAGDETPSGSLRNTRFEEHTMRTVHRFALAALALPLLALTACSDDDDNPTAPATQARVMAVHASPDAPAVDLLVDNAVVGTGLAYPNHTAYLNVTAGTRNVKVNVSGTSTSVIDANLPVTGGAIYSVFATGAAASIEPLVVPDDLATPAAGKAHVRFVHLSPDAPAVDVAVAGGAVLFADQSFREYTAFTPVDAGTYDLEVRLAGTPTVALAVPDVTVQAGKIYTVFARGFASGSGAQALGAQIIVNN
jgi:hypothetical protein